MTDFTPIKHTFTKHLKQHLGRTPEVHEIIMFMENFVEKLYTKSYGIWADVIPFDDIYSKEFYKDIQKNFNYKGKAFRVVGYSMDSIKYAVDFNKDREDVDKSLTNLINTSEPVKRRESLNNISWSKSRDGVDSFLNKINRRRDVEVYIKQEVNKSIDVQLICETYLEFLGKNRKYKTYDRYDYPLGKNMIINKAKDMYQVKEILALLGDFEIIDININT